MNEHSLMFDFVASQYQIGIDIVAFVDIWITKDEYKEITSMDFGTSSKTKYNILILDGYYLSVDNKGNIHLAKKGVGNYQQAFNYEEIENLQNKDQIKGRIDLDKCKEKITE